MVKLPDVEILLLNVITPLPKPLELLMVMFFAPVMERAPTVEPKVIAALLLPLALIARLLLSRMFVSTVNTDMAF